ncbi:hypothetical protein BDB00DRAFT_928769 [Zychaea mexicana]|uniref:uncharacterized protein n=1 Tax=Zychaea mexicana TaxID=64656 RepID=UPI0022FDFE4E|nr:uncharacterized protein BDB00DRAFT_928769 [Zychaea mexicana]KAI9493843.1 hypothetical protein BDB00DRAFT_928769 [Zychaea mexicana]
MTNVSLEAAVHIDRVLELSYLKFAVLRRFNTSFFDIITLQRGIFNTTKRYVHGAAALLFADREIRENRIVWDERGLVGAHWRDSNDLANFAGKRRHGDDDDDDNNETYENHNNYETVKSDYELLTTNPALVIVTAVLTCLVWCSGYATDYFIDRQEQLADSVALSQKRLEGVEGNDDYDDDLYSLEELDIKLLDSNAYITL